MPRHINQAPVQSKQTALEESIMDQKSVPAAGSAILCPIDGLSYVIDRQKVGVEILLSAMTHP